LHLRVESKHKYKTADALLGDAVKILGANLHPDRRRSLSPTGLLDKYIQRFEQIILEEEKFTETVEVLAVHVRNPSIEHIPVTAK
jgi:hypothetical protein